MSNFEIEKRDPSAIYDGRRFRTKEQNDEKCDGRMITTDTTCSTDRAGHELSKCRKRAQKEETPLPQLYEEEIGKLIRHGCDFFPEFPTLEVPLYQQPARSELSSLEGTQHVSPVLKGETEVIDNCNSNINKQVPQKVSCDSLLHVSQENESTPISKLYKEEIRKLNHNGMDLVDEIPELENFKSSLYQTRRMTNAQNLMKSLKKSGSTLINPSSSMDKLTLEVLQTSRLKPAVIEKLNVSTLDTCKGKTEDCIDSEVNEEIPESSSCISSLFSIQQSVCDYKEASSSIQSENCLISVEPPLSSENQVDLDSVESNLSVVDKCESNSLSESTFEVIETKRGKAAALSNGYRYRQKRQTKAGVIFWICVNDKLVSCRGRMFTKDNTIVRLSQHDCNPDAAANEVAKQIFIARKRAKEECTPIPKIYKEEIGKLNVNGMELMAKIPEFEKFKASLYKIRRMANAQNSIESTLNSKKKSGSNLISPSLSIGKDASSRIQSENSVTSSEPLQSSENQADLDSVESNLSVKDKCESNSLSESLEQATFELIETTRGKASALSNGYRYRKKRVKMGNIIYWLCMKDKAVNCRGGMYTKDNTIVRLTKHVCNPDVFANNVAKQIFIVRKRAKEESTPIPKIYKEEIGKLNVNDMELMAKIPEFDKFKASLYKIRRTANAQNSIESTLKSKKKSKPILLKPSSSAFEVVRTKKGHPAALHEGHRYRIHRKYPEITHWLCTSEKRTGCRGAMTTNGNVVHSVTRHDCIPDAPANEVAKQIFVAKKRAREEDTPISIIYKEEIGKLQNLDTVFISKIPKFDSFRCTLSRERHRNKKVSS